MPRASRWKKRFGYAKKPTVTVQVSGKDAELTDTQAYRFDELTHTDKRTSQTVPVNPIEQPRYSLEDAAFRLMTSESVILQRATSGSIKLYASAAGLAGRWRRLDGNGNSMESSLRTLRSGYLGLTALSCKELELHGGAKVLVFEFPDNPDLSALDLDFETQQELSAWGTEKKCFCVSEPHWVDSDGVVLLAPLVAVAPPSH